MTERVRVATFNVKGLREGPAKVANAVRAIDPDLLLVQESGSRRALARLAAAVSMTSAGDPRSPLRRRVKDAVLARPPWRLSSVRLVRFPGGRRWYPRGALVARVERDGGPGLWALSVHLGLRGAERGAQSKALLELVESLDDPAIVVGGDLNATPDMRAAARIATVLGDAWSIAGEGDGATFPARAPAARIDDVFVGPALEVEAAWVHHVIASDHLPVVVELVCP